MNTRLLMELRVEVGGAQEIGAVLGALAGRCRWPAGRSMVGSAVSSSQGAAPPRCSFERNGVLELDFRGNHRMDDGALIAMRSFDMHVRALRKSNRSVRLGPAPRTCERDGGPRPRASIATRYGHQTIEKRVRRMRGFESHRGSKVVPIWIHVLAPAAPSAALHSVLMTG